MIMYESSLPSPTALRRVGLLGRGSYGAVYLAIDDLTHWQVAVKTAHIDYACSLEKEKRVYEAFRGYPEFIQCYSDMKTTERGFKLYNLLLEYAPAGTLADLILRTSGGRGMPESDVRIYARMILRGLHCMHAKGYVHCDLKPLNILAFPSPDATGCYQLKIADFGLVKEPREEVRRESWKGRFRGTPYYISPESVAEGMISPAMDIWSLGCTVMQMINGGSYPWPGMEQLSPAEYGVLLASSSLDPMALLPFMSETGKQFLSICFERDPSKRWSAKMLLRHPYIAGAASETPRTASAEGDVDVLPPTLDSLLPRGLLS